jgi:putative addiction module CopG family antidote
MDVPLKPELQRFVEEQVKSGQFSSPAEVIEAGLARLMLDPPADELDAETLAAIEAADAQIDRGEGIPLDEAFQRLRRKHFGR